VSSFLTISVVVLYGVSAFMYLAVLIGDRPRLDVVGFGALVGGLALHVTSLIMTAVSSGIAPLLTISQGIGTLALVIGVGFVALRGVYRLHSLGSFAVPLMVLLATVAALADPGLSAPTEWRGHILLVHIIAAIGGTAAFALAAFTSLLYLFQHRSLKQKKFGPLFNRLPSIDVLDKANVRLISIGFAVYTVAIGLGAFFAWDNATTLKVQYLFAIVSWGIYAGILHARVTIGWRGRRAAMLTVLGVIGLGAVLSAYLTGAG
jgi:ABC-type uncharacterized transport system permease subunit